MRKEVWREIKEFPAYEISDLGRVRNTNGKVLKPIESTGGYKIVHLRNKTCKRKRYIHRLVATAFIDNPFEKPCVNHIDNDPGNNEVGNLEWCTKKENSEWMVKQGRNKRTSRWLERQAIARVQYEKPVKAINIETGEVLIFESVNSTKAEGFSPGLVSMCCNGKAKTHKGYIFTFANEERRNAKHHTA